MTDGEPARAAIVTGATGLVGRYLRPLLRERGISVQAISRRPPAGRLGAPWHAMDLLGEPGQAGTLEPATALFHTAPLWLLPPWLSTFAELGVRRVVAFSSTSRLTKEASGSSRESETARRLAEAEAAVAEACQEGGIRWTIFRPTLIYGGGHDRNVSDIARWIGRFGFFPLAGEGRGMRQPVHAEDLAAACLAVLGNATTYERIYELPGGEALPYREMVARVAQGLGRRPRLVRLPLRLLRAILAAARGLPGYGHLTPEMANRMNEDLVFDPSPARRDFGYDPRPFRFPDPSPDG